jgi:hypothetical protein
MEVMGRCLLSRRQILEEMPVIAHGPNQVRSRLRKQDGPLEDEAEVRQASIGASLWHSR